ncbi:hypothetical protein [Nostoc sp. FACHB-280]|uniref:hypothetical protein n=1 Tax=Nostoc sp. FACHB-280 TaxID=2692839 RepID=UPI00168AB557|nr:hypothetical protein [Nostoc sp. FACHB-280]MBD2497892.1 hypothetical protein [Nostoc sp. FACHB-280]
MTHNIYTAQQLQRKSLSQLKVIYSQLASAVEVTDKRYKKSWINAITAHQSAQLKKVDQKTQAQAELNRHITDQAQAVAPEELRIVDISFFDKEYYADDKLIATVTHDDDDFVTQRWVIMINNAEVFRAATPMMCDRYIRIHYKDGTLPVQEEAGGQGSKGAGEKNSCSVSSPATGNEIMAQIFNACEQHGLELLDDGIYQDDVKLGEVGCTDGHWWVIRAASGQHKMACGSPDEAVRMLLVVKAGDWDDLLDKPFDQLSKQEWRLLMEFEPVRELVAA